jgi:uncharacterized membrane protein
MHEERQSSENAHSFLRVDMQVCMTQVTVREHSIKLIAFVDACLIYTLSRRHWWAYISLVEVAWLDLPKTWLDLHGMTMRKLDTR